MAKDISKLFDDLKELVTDAARTASVEIMNGLVEAGPGFSGQFSSAWYAVEPGKNPGGARSAGNFIYKYDLRNVPKARFRAGTYYEIVNGIDYAPQALDLEEGRFIRIGDPIKDPVAQGKRYGTTRGEVSNVGLGALEDSTLRKRLLTGEDASKVVIEELPRWNKAGSLVLEGLVREDSPGSISN